MVVRAPVAPVPVTVLLTEGLAAAAPVFLAAGVACVTTRFAPAGLNTPLLPIEGLYPGPTG